ncbi:MAG: PIG-L family deacetylase [Ardenticatenaceae bacterium]|nr:PIG-L family deacetylase [Ardenticatenaceae bacterium]
MSKALCIVAHPDDETMWTGGVLAALAARSWDVEIIATTRGEGGERGEPPLVPDDPLLVGRLRAAELRCAADTLGAELTILDYQDPPMDGDWLLACGCDPIELTGRLRAIIASRRPLAVITHGRAGEYGHPQHMLVNLLTRRAIETLPNSPPELWTFMAWYAPAPAPDQPNLNVTDPADLVLDLGPYYFVKRQAAECHQSQHALFRRHSETGDLDELVRHIESLHLARSTAPLEASSLFCTLAGLRRVSDER